MPTVIRAAAFAVVVATVCAACSINGASADPAAWHSAPALASFTVVYPGGDLSHKQGIAMSIARFEQSHPNILISESNETGAGSYTEFLKSIVAVGEFPDLIEVRDAELFAEAGLLLEVPEELTYPLKPLTQVLGRVYTLPLERTAPQGIIYNKRLFRKAGIESLPRTYGEFLADNDKLKKVGVVPVVVGAKDLWHIGFWINKFMIDEVYAEDPDWNRKRSEGAASWTDPAPTRAMAKLVGLWERNDIAADYGSTADSQTVSRLVSGEAAMLFSGPWMFNQIHSADPGFEFGFFPLPDDEGRLNLAAAPSSNGWAISSEVAKDPDKLLAIRQFLTFFYDDANYGAYLEMVNGLSARREATIEPKSKAMTAMLSALEDPSTTLASPMNDYTGPNALPPSYRDWFYSKMLRVLTGSEPLASALRDADRQWDRAGRMGN